MREKEIGAQQGRNWGKVATIGDLHSTCSHVHQSKVPTHFTRLSAGGSPSSTIDQVSSIKRGQHENETPLRLAQTISIARLAYTCCSGTCPRPERNSRKELSQSRLRSFHLYEHQRVFVFLPQVSTEQLIVDRPWLAGLHSERVEHGSNSRVPFRSPGAVQILWHTESFTERGALAPPLNPHQPQKGKGHRNEPLDRAEHVLFPHRQLALTANPVSLTRPITKDLTEWLLTKASKSASQENLRFLGKACASSSALSLICAARKLICSASMHHTQLENKGLGRASLCCKPSVKQQRQGGSSSTSPPVRITLTILRR